MPSSFSEDDNHGFALYAVAAGARARRRRTTTPPGRSVVGVEGEERNRLRIGGSRMAVSPDEARLEPAGETLVRPGAGVPLMPEDIHSIRRESKAPMLHFHLYGRSIEHLPERRQFDLEKGTSAVYPANPRVQK